MAKEVETVKYPLCGWYHPIEYKGSMRLIRGDLADQPKGEFLFGGFDLNQEAFIGIREVKGRGGGLPEIRRLTLAQTQADLRYKLVITSLANRSYQVSKILFPQNSFLAILTCLIIRFKLLA